MSAINEFAHWFGASNGLLGIISLPPERIRTRSVGVVLMNPGMLHRVGGARLNVRLARHLALRGFPSIRFDLSGLGDSVTRYDTRPYLESMAADVSEALDDLAKQARVVRFALVGHCSGAAVSYAAALSDARVAALVQIEGFAYPTRRYRLYRWRRTLLRPRTWESLVKGAGDLALIKGRRAWARFGTRTTSDLRTRSAESLEDFRRQLRGVVDLRPPQAEMRAGLSRLIARRVRMLNVFGGGEHHQYVYLEQFAEAFPDLDFGDLLEVEHVPDANHYFSALAHQAWLDNRIAATIERADLDLAAQTP
jgi:pimeloyl-ACP methyl ester carboxylesterase